MWKKEVPEAEILILATMSAGKSTLINALLGEYLLPVANQATTAKVFRIEDYNSNAFEVHNSSGVSKEKWVEVTPSKLKELNDSSHLEEINLRGNISGIKSKEVRLVIYDTPGPNNSQNNKHAKATNQFIKDGKYGLVLYVLNATQIGVNDDFYLLNELQKLHSRHDRKHKKIIFLLNKIDVLDCERGELLSEVVQELNTYLERHGFLQPIILPVSAYAALLAKRALRNEKLTTSEKHNLSFLNEQLSNSLNCVNKNNTLLLEVNNEIEEKFKASCLENKSASFMESLYGKFVRAKSADVFDESESSLSYKDLVKVHYSSGLLAVEHILQSSIKEIQRVKIHIAFKNSTVSLIVGGKVLSYRNSIMKSFKNHSIIEALSNLFSYIAKYGNEFEFVYYGGVEDFNVFSLKFNQLKERNSYTTFLSYGGLFNKRFGFFERIIKFI